MSEQAIFQNIDSLNKEKAAEFLQARLQKIAEIKKEAEEFQSQNNLASDEIPPPIYLGSNKLPDSILLHTCCAPCMIYPYHGLSKLGLKLMLYFYNPNIHPQEEWEKRATGTKIYAEKYQIPYLIEGESLKEKWLNFKSRNKSQHCQLCYGMRFIEVAKKCQELGYSGFTTSLTISPYQNHEKIHQIAAAAAKRYSVEYYPFDFKPGFYHSQALAKEENIYRQKYCGCMYSISESFYAKKIAKSHGLDPADLPSRNNN